MSKATQYSTDGGATWQQFGLTTADITTNGLVANQFISVKDKDDNLLIMCGSTIVSSSNRMGIIKIDKTGTTKKKAVLNWDYSGFGILHSDGVAYTSMAINRNNITATITATRSSGGNAGCVYWSIPLDFEDGALIAEPAGNNTPTSKFAIYQDRYIWVASGTTIKIYDYETKAELAGVSTDGQPIQTMVLSSDNTLYYVQAVANWLKKATFNGINTITKTLVSNSGYVGNQKQLLIDKWGDLIILTNSGTASTLLKYTSAGVQVGTTPLTLQAPMYNLNVDKDGAIFYSNDLGTYKINKNSAGQQPLVLGTKIRDTGMTTYGNRVFLDPAVFN